MPRVAITSLLLSAATVLLIGAPGKALASEAPCRPSSRPPCPEVPATAPCAPEESPCLG